MRRLCQQLVEDNSALRRITPDSTAEGTRAQVLQAVAMPTGGRGKGKETWKARDRKE